MNEEEILRVFSAQLTRYPAMQAVDALKLLYQAVFGGGHLIADPERCRRYLAEEFRTVLPEEGELLEDIGNGMVRVRLAALPAEKLEALAACFIRSSSEVHGSPQAFEEAYAVLSERFGQLPFAFAKGELEAQAELIRGSGYRPVSHSEAYRAAYHPAYRVCLRSLAEALL